MAFTATQKVFMFEDQTLAIFKDARDTLPFYDPYNYLPRLLYHSDLDYIRIVDERTFNINLPSRQNFKDAAATYKLYQHGRGGFPFVLGSLPVGGKPCVFAGSVPVQLGAGTTNVGPRGFARWLSLGADDTWVYVHEYVVNNWNNNTAYGGYSAITVPVTVWMTSEMLEGGADIPPPDTGTLFVLSDYLSMGNGKFDSRNRFIRKVTNPADKTINMGSGQLLGVSTTVGGQAAWAWKCGDASVQSVNTGLSPPSGFNIGIAAAI